MVAIPFIIDMNKTLVQNIFSKYNEHIFKNFVAYFYRRWNIFINIGLLNYILAQKKKRGEILLLNITIKELKYN